jgi:dipeptidyl aminopeptidase/acylaminoacyl peptidase
MTTNRLPQSKSLQPLDRIAIAIVLILSVLIGIVIFFGDHSTPRVRSFSWQGERIGAEDLAFILTFNRPMDRQSVEQNLQIEPALPGKFSWAGRRMAYTLNDPAPYGQEFAITLTDARDRYAESDANRPAIDPFQQTFRSRDRAFAYVGVEGEEAGRLILSNITQQEDRILTPPNLSVIDFEPYAAGDKILVSAVDRAAEGNKLLNQQLYTVTTGMPADAAQRWSWLPWRGPQTQPAGQMELVLDNRDYQNLRFDLSPDGQVIVVQRVQQNDPTDFGPWIVRDGEPPQRLETDPGGDFLITPDSTALVLAQGEGLAILPLQAETEPLDFLPQFGMVLDFARDGSAAAMVKFNTDYTRTLFVVTNQGEEIEVLSTEGSILDAQFSPDRQTLYCLLTNLLPGDRYLEQPYLTAVDLETQEQTDLLLMPIQQNAQMSLAPDGLGILLEQSVAATVNSGNTANLPKTRDGRMITDSQLWFLPIVRDEDGTILAADPEPLAIAGVHPQWLP